MKKTIFYPVFIFLLAPCFLAAQDMAYPVEGDGILSFLRRWNRVDTAYVREFTEMNKERLNSKGGLELGTVYLIPPLHEDDETAIKNTNYEGIHPAIFGEKYRNLTSVSNRLKDACFYIVSGHGGPDPGAISKVGGKMLHEHEYAYDVALRLARSLMTEGATVYVVIQDPDDGIRDDKYLKNGGNETCMGDPIPHGQLDRLKQRVDAVNRLYKRDRKKFKYFRSISIHVDSRSKDKQLDVFFYHSVDSDGKSVAYTLRDVFQEKYNKFQPGRGFQGIVEQRDLYVLRNLKPTSILVEIGNIQNEFDRRRVVLENNRQAMANWITQGFIKDYEKSRR